MMIEKSEIRTDTIVCRFQLGRRAINRREQIARIQVVFLNVKLVFSKAKNPRARSKSRKKSPELMIFFLEEKCDKKTKKKQCRKDKPSSKSDFFIFYIFQKT